MIVRGRKIHPTDVEEIAESVPGIRAGCTAAVQLDSGMRANRIVLVAEARQRDGDGVLAGRVTARVLAALSVQLDDVVLLPPGTIPKTSSGKICRSATRAMLQEDRLSPGRSPTGCAADG